MEGESVFLIEIDHGRLLIFFGIPKRPSYFGPFESPKKEVGPPQSTQSPSKTGGSLKGKERSAWIIIE